MSDGDSDNVDTSEGVQKPMDVAENSGSEDDASEWEDRLGKLDRRLI